MQTCVCIIHSILFYCASATAVSCENKEDTVNLLLARGELHSMADNIPQWSLNGSCGTEEHDVIHVTKSCK